MNDATTTRGASALWSMIAEPPSPALALIEQVGAAEALDMLSSGALSGRAELAEYVPRWLARLEERDVRSWRMPDEQFLLASDPHWPARLDDLGPERPIGLWVRGEARVLTWPAVTVVGARAATEEGREIAGSFAAELSSSHVIVSGGAFGIDVAAHEGALAGGGATVAVMACGVDRAYPARHARIFGRILTAGAVISEYPPGTPPARHRFLVRNRLIAALGEACLVVEAQRRSGALATARRAAEIGREVLAVPGPIHSRMSAGTNQLLRDYGICATSPRDVLEALGHVRADPLPPVPIRTYDHLRGDEARVHDALTDRPQPACHIARSAGLAAGETDRALQTLAGLGLAKEVAGRWHRLVP